MKFKNHTLFALALAVAANTPIPALAGISIGSVYPDKMDFFLSGGSERAFFKLHRGFSHWPWTYIAIFASMLMWPGVIHTLWGQFLMGIVSGAALHILGDMCTPGGIPHLPWSLKKKFGFKWFKTGSIKEYLFTWSVVLTCGMFVVGQYWYTGKVPTFHIQKTLHDILRAYTDIQQFIQTLLY